MPLPQALIEKIQDLVPHLEAEKNEFNDLLREAYETDALTEEQINANFAAKANFAERAAELLATLRPEIDFIEPFQNVFSDIANSSYFSTKVSNMALEIFLENEKLVPKDFIEDTVKQVPQVIKKINALRTAISNLYDELILQPDKNGELINQCFDYVERIDDSTDTEVYTDISNNHKLPLDIRQQVIAIVGLIEESHNSSEEEINDDDDSGSYNNNNTNNRNKRTSEPNQEISSKKARSAAKNYEELLFDLGGATEEASTSFPASTAPISVIEKRKEKLNSKEPSKDESDNDSSSEYHPA